MEKIRSESESAQKRTFAGWSYTSPASATEKSPKQSELPKTQFPGGGKSGTYPQISIARIGTSEQRKPGEQVPSYLLQDTAAAPQFCCKTMNTEVPTWNTREETASNGGFLFAENYIGRIQRML